MAFRNIAIIAHVDHGKTTLVDKILAQCHAFGAHEQIDDRVMDSMDLERERGITITSKNTAVFYKDVKINILDTPGHADFGGEVERVLSMVEGAILLVDASEGPLPQTRFVLRKAMEAGLVMAVCVNKIDRPDARIAEVLNEIYDLFIDLGANDEQLDFPVLYAFARAGVAHYELGDEHTDLTPLLDTIVNRMPPPRPSPVPHDGPQFMATNLDYDAYVGRLAVGRLFGATLSKGQPLRHFTADAERTVRPQLLYTWRGLRRIEVKEVEPGDIVAIAGIEDITVGDSLVGGEDPKPLPRVKVDEPTIGMTMGINNSPYSGKDGKFLTSRQIGARLEREVMSNVSLRVEETPGREAFKVYGRGELQLAILVEQMRREGFEMTLSRPEVVRKQTPEGTLEPYEVVTLDVPEANVGAMTQALAARKGLMLDMAQDGRGRSRLVYRIPSRGLIGFRGEFLTETRGEGVMNALFDGWDEDVGHIMHRSNGGLVADRTGVTTTYALYKLQPRATKMFCGPGEDVYEGMIIGEHIRENDLNVDCTRAKQLTNFRSAGADEKQILFPPVLLTLERAMEFIDDEELIEVTPHHIRLRKRVLETNKRSIVRRERDSD